MDKPSITIVVPTYNRSLNLKNQLNNILSSEANQDNLVMILNDGSSDNTEEILDVFTSNVNFDIINHKSNIGLARNMSFAIQNCKTDYLLWITDDDIFDFSKIGSLRDLLRLNDFDFISTHFPSREGIRDIYKDKELSIFDIWKHSKHASGLIFKSSSAREQLHELQKRLDLKCLVAQFFPQVVLLFNMFLKNKKLYASKIAVGKQPDKVEETNLKDEHGNHYLSIHNVLERYIAFNTFYDDIKCRGMKREFELIKEVQSFSFFNQFYLGVLKDSSIDPNKLVVSAILSNIHPRKFIYAVYLYLSYKIRFFLSKYKN